jgi:hypothetical protein
VAKVVKTTLRQARLVEDSMELVTHYCSVDWLPIIARKDEISRIPSRAGFLSFLLLASAVISKLRKCDCRQGERSTTSLCLRLNQLELSIDPLQLPGDSQHAQIEVDVLPSQAEGLTLPQAHSQRDGVKRL